jgi:deazaflavin-dependent oxidoreductase (nitroreductase family)
MGLPRGMAVGVLGWLAIAWGLYAIDPHAWPGIVAPIAQSAVCLVLVALTARSRRAKVVLVRTLQRWTINPLVRLLLRLGLNPLGLVLLETRGRVSGRPRRTPVGNGRSGDSLWIIAEHGTYANYVRNIQADPRVRVRLRVGLRHRWVAGLATVLPDDDALARQRSIIRWHPLRMLNAMVVRILGGDLLTVHVQLLPDRRTEPPAHAQPPPAAVPPRTASRGVLPEVPREPVRVQPGRAPRSATG